MADNAIKILSLGGGGIRGIFTLVVLEAIAKELENQGKSQSFANIFHLIAGTSAGGITALGLTAPKQSPGGGYLNEPHLTLDDLRNLFEQRGREIFPVWLSRKLRAIVQLFSEKYSADGIEGVAADIVEDRLLSDALTNVLVTTYDTVRRRPFYFRVRNKKGATRPAHVRDLDFFMRDAARATSAAPTYFEAAKITAQGPGSEENRRDIIYGWLTEDGRKKRSPPFPQPYLRNEFSLIDGGVFCNNPAMTAYIQARQIYPDAERFTVVSVGTGRTNRSFEHRRIADWGANEWVGIISGVPLLSMMMDGQSDNADLLLQDLPGVDFYSFDGELTGANDDMDDASDENIGALIHLAQRLFSTAEEQSRIKDLCQKL